MTINCIGTNMPIEATKGGTGQSTYSTGDTLYASAANTLSKLPIGSFGAFQGIASTSIPAWISPNAYSYFFDDLMHFELAPWSSNIAGGSLTRSTSGVANHPGIWTLSTLGSATGAANIHLLETSVVLDGGQISIEWEIRIPTLSDGTDTFTIRSGIMDNANPAESNNAVYFRYTHGVNSGNWQLIARNGGAETPTNSSTAVTTGWTKLTIIIVPGSTLATFYVDGVSVGTVASGIPTTNPMGLQSQIVKSLGGNARTLLLDYCSMFYQLATAR